MRATAIIALILTWSSITHAEEVEPWHAESIDEDALLRAVEALPPATGPTRSWPSWSKHGAVANLPLIEKVAPLGLDQRRALSREGFAVTSTTVDTFGHMYHLIYTQDLPLFVTMDSLLFAVGAGYEAMLEHLETHTLAPRTASVLALMHGQLPMVSRGWDKTLARDLDLYLAVARSLLAGTRVSLVLGGSTADRDALLDGITAAAGVATMTVFGRERSLDFTLYRPRGAYTNSAARQQWFRAAYFLQMFELNVVSRGCRSSQPGYLPDPRETPREAAVALALAELVRGSGVGAELARIDRTLTSFVGERVDASPAALQTLEVDLSALADARRFEALQAQVAAAIGPRFARSAPTHPMPTVPELPVVATLFGVHATESTAALAALLTPAVPERTVLTGPDVAFVLGHARALTHLREDLAATPQLRGALDHARLLLRETDGDTLRGSWLDAIHALAEPIRASAPSFMRTPAFADQRINSAIAAYAQLRHANVLLEAQSYSVGGCDIPDAFVEPAPATLAALRAYAQRGQALAALLGDKADIGAYFTRMDRIFAVLERIVQRELLGQPLLPAELAFLHQIAEERDFIYDDRLDFDGWYFDLYFSRGRSFKQWDESTPKADFQRSGALVADIATAADESGAAHVSHLGTSQPRFAVFVVDTGGAPRAMAGPVATAYAVATPIEGRLDDATAKELPLWDLRMPWLATTAPWVARRPPPEPDVRVAINWSEPPSYEVYVETDAPQTLHIRVVDGRNRSLFDRRLSLAAGSHTFPFVDRSGARDTEPTFTITLRHGKHRWSGTQLDLGSYANEYEP